jgi:hypothetical protein
MARTVSYKPDRERFEREAREWRAKEAVALVAEAEPRGGQLENLVSRPRGGRPGFRFVR